MVRCRWCVVNNSQAALFFAEMLRWAAQGAHLWVVDCAVRFFAWEVCTAEVNQFSSETAKRASFMIHWTRAEQRNGHWQEDLSVSLAVIISAVESQIYCFIGSSKRVTRDQDVKTKFPREFYWSQRRDWDCDSLMGLVPNIIFPLMITHGSKWRQYANVRHVVFEIDCGRQVTIVRVVCVSQLLGRDDQSSIMSRVRNIRREREIPRWKWLGTWSQLTRALHVFFPRLILTDSQQKHSKSCFLSCTNDAWMRGLSVGLFTNSTKTNFTVIFF